MLTQGVTTLELRGQARPASLHPPLEEAVSAASAGDTRAFERLYRAHVARVHSLARRMAGDGEADEFTQEIFIRAWEKLPQFRGDSAFGTWLYRLAVNHLLTRWRSQGLRRARFLDDEKVLERAMETVPARPAGVDLQMDVEAGIARLPDGSRAVFVLHDVEGYRHEEIAQMLGINEGTSKSQLHRARMALRGFLTQPARAGDGQADHGGSAPASEAGES
jgi:RNA polymerase sigma-70 factor (ECF subfamily)